MAQNAAFFSFPLKTSRARTRGDRTCRPQCWFLEPKPSGVGLAPELTSEPPPPPAAKNVGQTCHPELPVGSGLGQVFNCPIVLTWDLGSVGVRQSPGPTHCPCCLRMWTQRKTVSNTTPWLWPWPWPWASEFTRHTCICSHLTPSRTLWVKHVTPISQVKEELRPTQAKEQVPKFQEGRTSYGFSRPIQNEHMGVLVPKVLRMPRWQQ